jgi:hypothetical protein
MKKIKIKRTGGPAPGTPSPLKGRPSPLRGRQFPHLWTSGPDPDHHRLWRKFLVARNQARYWRQAWSVSWETYRDLLLPHRNNLGRGRDAWNLIRRDRNLPWTEDNVIAAQRITVVTGKKAGHRTYLPPHELARRREAMIKYKQRGYTGKRYRRYDTE